MSARPAPFVPLGDLPGGVKFFMPEPREPLPSGKAIVFDPDYQLWLASEREARRWLLFPWRFLMQRGVPLDEALRNIDPYVAQELHRQEERDKELRDEMDALFGKASDWRIALLIEARLNDHARRELTDTLTRIALAGEEREFALFGDAVATFARIKATGPTKLVKAAVLMFILSCRANGESPPTRAETDQLLERIGILGNAGRNVVRDVYSGPIAGYLAQRVGRPRKNFSSKVGKMRNIAR